ncbi:hypothetical protein GGR50DRAFT_437456 [Xylaria sp. CBS 124048]|nr:hypothetical protein GGR50DRAFT_437456 [Xylaria sp. CBS 124048]
MHVTACHGPRLKAQGPWPMALRAPSSAYLTPLETHPWASVGIRGLSTPSLIVTLCVCVSLSFSVSTVPRSVHTAPQPECPWLIIRNIPSSTIPRAGRPRPGADAQRLARYLPATRYLPAITQADSTFLRVPSRSEPRHQRENPSFRSSTHSPRVASEFDLIYPCARKSEH